VRWIKRGRIFHVDGESWWMSHHAAVPVPDVVGERLRIYFAPRDEEGRSRTALVEVDAANPSIVHAVHDEPILDLGALGTFDDSGVMPSCIVEADDGKYLYYTGWNQGTTVPYRNAIGVAVSSDGGLTFERAYEGPLVDRSRDEPFFTATPFVLREGDRWRMWYASSTGWVVVEGRPEPLYVIKYAESDDGLVWRRDNLTCIEPKQPEEANARPWVIGEAGWYRMWFCYRGSRGYREDRRMSYRIGYAESADGITWERKDDEAGIDVSDEGWDSTMVEYPSVYEYGGTLHLLYNGDGFGTTGIGHAIAAS
jgi:hypothetical protein